MFLWHSPLAMLAKSAPILTEELFTDTLPLAWELLLDSSQQLAAAAGKLGVPQGSVIGRVFTD